MRSRVVQARRGGGRIAPGEAQGPAQSDDVIAPSPSACAAAPLAETLPVRQVTQDILELGRAACRPVHDLEFGRVRAAPRRRRGACRAAGSRSRAPAPARGRARQRAVVHLADRVRVALVDAATRTGDRPLLEVDDLEVRLKNVRGVDGLSMHIAKGETLGLVGESGSGKSTTDRAALQLVPTAAGSIRLDGTDLATADAAARRNLRRRAQMMFQDQFGSLKSAHAGRRHHRCRAVGDSPHRRPGGPAPAGGRAAERGGIAGERGAPLSPQCCARRSQAPPIRPPVAVSAPAALCAAALLGGGAPAGAIRRIPGAT